MKFSPILEGWDLLISLLGQFMKLNDSFYFYFLVYYQRCRQIDKDMIWYDFTWLLYDIWYVIYDIDVWFMTYDAWCMMYDIWYVIWYRDYKTPDRRKLRKESLF